MRIKSRAVTRLGDLLEDLEKLNTGRPKLGEASHLVSPHAQARVEAAVSKDQAKQAQAVARIGELTREMPRAPAGNARVAPKSPTGTQAHKREALAAEGLSRKDAAECEKIAPIRGRA
jgi:hypothetical protein